MSEEDGLVAAFRFDGAGGGRALDWRDLDADLAAEEGFLWVHLSRDGERGRTWLAERSGLPALAVEALLAEETRPRASVFDGALLLNLRGANLNPDSEPEDMVSLRCWVDARIAVTVRLRRLRAVDDVRAALGEGCGPTGPGALVTMLAAQLTDRMGPFIFALDDRVDQLEDDVITAESMALRPRIHELRREAIAYRRFVAPQREALGRLAAEPVPWLGLPERQRLREVADRVTRYVEDLDAIRERAAVAQDELTSRLSEQMNRKLYVISLVAGVFLPLGLITGLLGINVGGIPGAETGWAFAAVAAGLAVIGIAELWYLRRRGWF